MKHQDNETLIEGWDTTPPPAASAARHAPEPWQSGGELDRLEIGVEDSTDPNACDGTRRVALVTCGDYEITNYDEHTANAARIVACVNACSGLADPAAELAALRARAEMAEELAAALELAELEMTQARLASTIGKQTLTRRVDFLIGQLERIGSAARAALAKFNAAGGAK